MHSSSSDSENSSRKRTPLYYSDSDDEKPAPPPQLQYSKWNPWGYCTRTQVFLWVMAAFFPLLLPRDRAIFDPPAGIRRYVAVFITVHALVFNSQFSREFFVELGFHWAFIGGIVLYLYFLFGLGIFTRWLAASTVCWVWPGRANLDVRAGQVIHFLALNVLFEILAKNWMEAIREREQESRMRVDAILEQDDRRHKASVREEEKRVEAAEIEWVRVNGPRPKPKPRIGEPPNYKAKRLGLVKPAPPYAYPAGFPPC